MAILQGVVQYTGKLGQTVGQRSATGKHAVRVYRDTIKNPKTDGQSVQRMVLATVGVAVSYLTEILNNAFEGVQNGAQSLNHVRSLWLKMLRTSNANQSDSTFKYLPKGKKLFVPNPYQISSGRLSAPNLAFVDGESRMYDIFVDTTYTASQAFPSIAVGDQITLICIASVYGTEISTEVGYCRFAFKDDSTPVFYQNNDGDISLNPEAIDLSKAQGPWRNLLFDGRGTSVAEVNFLSLVSENADMASAIGVIVSNIENKRRSTSYLVVNEDPNWDDYNGANVYPTYGNSGIEMDFPNDWYLNNSARRTGASGNIIKIDLPLPQMFSNLPNTTFTYQRPDALTTGAGTIHAILGGPSHEDKEVYKSSDGEVNHTELFGDIQIGFDEWTVGSQIVDFSFTSSDTVEDLILIKRIWVVWDGVTYNLTY